LQLKYPNWTDYWVFINNDDINVKFERAYLLSFLISRGEVDVKISPIDRKIQIRISKRKDIEDRKLSLVVNLGEQNE
jgi:hypothetical protein